MAESIHPDNNHVFVCIKGHVSKEANGYSYNGTLRCKKLIRPEGSDKGVWAPCRKKTIILSTEFARSLYGRGWKGRNHEIRKISRWFRNIVNTILMSLQQAGVVRVIKA